MRLRAPREERRVVGESGGVRNVQEALKEEASEETACIVERKILEVGFP